MRLPYLLLIAGAAMIVANPTTAAERRGTGRIPQDFQAELAGMQPPPIITDSTNAKPLVSFAVALARSLGINLEIRNGRADLFTFHPTQSDTIALSAGVGASGTFLNLRWRLGN